jgi:hypothetical protein
MSLLQGTIQGVVAGTAASFAPNPVVLSEGFSVIQWFIAGTLSGVLFQYVYGKAVSCERVEPLSVEPLSEANIAGAMAIGR